jgi:hypothetical protein
MSEDLDYFDPLGLLRTAVENNTAAHFKNLQKLQAKASAQRAFASSAAPAPFAGHGQARLPPPPLDHHPSGKTQPGIAAEIAEKEMSGGSSARYAGY